MPIYIGEEQLGNLERNQYCLEVYFTVDREIHYGDVGDTEIAAAMTEFLGDRFGVIHVLHGELHERSGRWDHGQLVVDGRTGAHWLKGGNTDALVDYVDVLPVELKQDSASGMHTKNHLDDTMQRFLRATEEIGKEEKEEKGYKAKHRAGWLKAFFKKKYALRVQEPERKEIDS